MVVVDVDFGVVVDVVVVVVDECCGSGCCRCGCCCRCGGML